jgi:predicted amidohydrolase
MQDLTVTLIQTELIWEDISANLAMFDEKMEGIAEKTDLIILPEMFTTGFTLNVAKVAEPMTGSAVNWLVHKARQKKSHITGSLIIAEDQKYYNRLIWAKPDGDILTYDKKHLFRMGDEHKVFSAGNRHLTVEVHGWRLRTFICYDLRFPVWCRNFANEYDVAIYVANWPARRAHHWKLLLPARAVENQSYVIGVNRVGKDGKGLAYSGDSSIVDPLGKILFHRADIPGIDTKTLSYETVQSFRETFAAWQDADIDAVSYPVAKATPS